MEKLISKIPEGPLAQKWTRFKSSVKLVNPANKKKIDIIVVGTGLSGAGAASALGELGYNVKNFCYQDSPRRAHSVAAQGGINAAKNYQNDGDSTFRLFYDMIKGGDYRAREANVFRAAEVSNQVIDHFTALGVPFARDYGRDSRYKILWRSPGVPDILCKRTNRSAMPARMLLVAEQADKKGNCKNVPPPGDARSCCD